jgi:hypothetical protein
MRSFAAILFALTLTACWTGKAPVAPTTTVAPVAKTAHEAPAPQPVERSYRAYTVTADVIGVTTMTAGLVGLHRDSNNALGGALLVTGMAIAGFSDPLIHLAHGHGSRALVSYGIRAVTVLTGMMAGMGASDCRDELFCGLEGMMWGSAAGLAVAGVADAFLLHGKLASQPWTARMSASEGGARVGIAAPF